MTAALQQTLPIFIYFPSAKLPKTGRPGVVIDTLSAIEITKDEQWLNQSNQSIN